MNKELTGYTKKRIKDSVKEAINLASHGSTTIVDSASEWLERIVLEEYERGFKDGVKHLSDICEMKDDN